MTRKPINVELALPSTPAHYWREMMARAKGFTLREIALASDGVAYATVKRYAHFLKAEGYIVRIGEKREGFALQAVYAVTRRVKEAPIMRRKPLKAPLTAQEALWNAMRVLTTFTIKELALSASTDERSIARGTADNYVRELTRAGVLVCVEKSRGRGGRAHGKSPGVFRLRRESNSGPKAPKLMRAGFVFDMNREAIVGEAVVTEKRS